MAFIATTDEHYTEIMITALMEKLPLHIVEEIVGGLEPAQRRELVGIVQKQRRRLG